MDGVSIIGREPPTCLGKSKPPTAENVPMCAGSRLHVDLLLGRDGQIGFGDFLTLRIEASKK